MTSPDPVASAERAENAAVIFLNVFVALVAIGVVAAAYAVGVLNPAIAGLAAAVGVAL